MACPHAAGVQWAVRQCPFLAKLEAQQGPDYAAAIALQPTRAFAAGEPAATVGAQSSPCEQLSAAFSLFHGPAGAVPLASGSAGLAAVRGCPFGAAPAPRGDAGAPAQASPAPRRAAPLPLAAISLGFGSGPNFGDFLRKRVQQHRQGGARRPPGQRPQPPQPPASNGSGAGAGGPHHAGGAGFKPQRPLADPAGGGGLGGAGQRAFGAAHGPQPPSASAASSAASHPAAPPSAGPAGGGPGSGGAALGGGGSAGAGFAAPPGPGPSSKGPAGGGATAGARRGAWGAPPSRAAARGGAAPGGAPDGARPAGLGGAGVPGASPPGAGASPACPMRTWLGPLAGMVFNQYDKLVCPPAIVAARAALSRTAAVQHLRPQVLPVKLLAVAAVAAASNLPCGAVRAHYEKFSVGWFVAVHATIPFVAMLRKAVIMPKLAMLVTFSAAVLGQALGARLEAARLAALERDGAADPLRVGAWLPGARVRARAPAAGAAAAPARDSGAWREKLRAGVRAGLGEDGGGRRLAGTSACASSSAPVVGLGSLLPQLPVVRA
ncbi:hypothetical protein HT031_000840 [Scenedesmus sp. PABB004]|nr:hypothetical protein HT031_000840 [Scenedesmus sp. PABB004]